MKLPEGYVVNGVSRKWYLYFLVDGMYPLWLIFLKQVQPPLNAQQKLLTAVQESRRKDIERFFGVLQGTIHMLNSNFHEWNDSEIVLVVETCPILHNMLKRISTGGELFDEEDEIGNPMHPYQFLT